MKKLLTAGALFAGLAFLPVTAEAQCCASATKVADKADKECSAAVTQVAKTECAKSCSGAVTQVAATECAKECSFTAKQVAATDCSTTCAVTGVAMGGATDPGKYGSDKHGYTMGKIVPDFTLKDAHGKEYSLSNFEGQPVVIAFWNHSCPFVVEMDERFEKFYKTYKEKGVAVLPIDAGDPSIENSPEELKKYAETRPFPILHNTDSELALNFAATRTPELFILDRNHRIVYHGAFDSGAAGIRSGNLETYAENAVNAILAGNTPEVTQTRAFGCTIKYNRENQQRLRQIMAEREAASEGREVSEAR